MEKMCEYGYEHGHVGHEHVPCHHYHMHEHREHRPPLTPEKELEVLEDWKKRLQNELTRIERRIEELKKEE